jgi:hypothetical protein
MAHEEHSEHHHGHEHHDMDSWSMAAIATLHCLTGCSLGEVVGLIVGTATGMSNFKNIILATLLAFVFGFTLSTLPLLKAGLNFVKAISIVAAADTLSIAAMELADNTVMWFIPGAMDATLIDPLYWLSMPVSLIAAFAVAWPVNYYLLKRHMGHALTMQYHH